MARRSGIAITHRKLTNAILGLLVVQFVLGILANLYGTVPTDKPYEVFHQIGWINLHAINGTILLILGITLVVRSRKGQSFGAALGGLICLALAFTFGELFVFVQEDIFSLFMAVAFIGAFMSYAKLAFSSKH